MAVDRAATRARPRRAGIGAGARAWPIGLYQPSLILTHFTEAIFAASQERVAPRCGTPQAARGRRWRQKAPGPRGWGTSARRGPRELLGDACPMSRIAPRAAPARAGRFATMKWVNIKEGRYYTREGDRGWIHRSSATPEVSEVGLGGG